MSDKPLAPTKDGNPRAAQVRIQGKSAGAIGGQRAHDLRSGPQPDYVDADRAHLNRVMITPQTGTQLRKVCEGRRKLRDTKRAMKSSAAVGVAGIITFGHEAQTIFERLTPDQQDAAYRETAEAIAKRLNTTLTGLVAHGDESAPHAHFQLPAYDLTGHPISETAKRGVLRELQTLTAEVMARHAPGIERGRSKADRLKAGASPSEVVNRSVAQLHDELPIEIEQRQATLAALNEKIATNERLADRARQKAAENADKAEKALRNAERYESRAAAARKERETEESALYELQRRRQEAEARIDRLREEQDAIRAETTRLQQEADTCRERLEAERASLSAVEARREAIEAETAQMREKALREAQEAAHATHRRLTGLAGSPEFYAEPDMEKSNNISRIVTDWKVIRQERSQLAEDKLEFEKNRDAVLDRRGQELLRENSSLKDQLRIVDAFLELLKKTLKAMFSDAEYKPIADKVMASWATHPDNPDRKQPAPRPTYSSGRSGP